MNVILTTNSMNLKNEFISKLLPKGINFIHSSKLEDVILTINPETRICLLDGDPFDESQLVNFIKTIKNSPGTEYCRIILLSGSSDIVVTTSYIKLGVDTILQRSLSDEVLVNKFFNFITNINDQYCQRKFIRIKPSTEQQMSINIQIAGQLEPLVGEITDISMGGVAARFPDLNSLTEKNIYSNTQIILSRSALIETNINAITADLTLIKKGGEIAAFHFNYIQDEAQEKLAQYIFSETQKLKEITKNH